MLHQYRLMKGQCVRTNNWSAARIRVLIAFGWENEDNVLLVFNTFLFVLLHSPFLRYIIKLYLLDLCNLFDEDEINESSRVCLRPKLIQKYTKQINLLVSGLYYLILYNFFCSSPRHSQGLHCLTTTRINTISFILLQLYFFFVFLFNITFYK